MYTIQCIPFYTNHFILLSFSHSHNSTLTNWMTVNASMCVCVYYEYVLSVINTFLSVYLMNAFIYEEYTKNNEKW